MFRENIEVRISSTVLGVLAIVCAAFMLRADTPGSLFAEVNDTIELWLALSMAVSGCMQIYGAYRPRRKVRQYGLILSSLAWFVLLGVLLTEWQLRGATLLIAVAGVATFIVYVEEVRRKPRDDGPVR